MKIKSTILLLLLLIGCPMFARRALNHISILHQPDGTSFKALVKGDEFNRIITDENGAAIIKNDDGFYCYARYGADGKKYSTGYIVGEEVPEYIKNESKFIPMKVLGMRASKFRREISRQHELRRTKAESGQPKMMRSLILLVQTKDKKFNFTRKNFEDLFFKPGYAYDGATGSVSEYFKAQLGNDINLEFTVSPIITLDKETKYYFSNQGESGLDINTGYAVREACEKASSAGIDFSQFDSDNDGEVDNVFVFVAGKDEADTGDEDNVWSHQYYLEFTDAKGTVLNGKKVNNYAISTEYTVKSGGKFGFSGIGTFCHEFTHVLGSKDLYDTDYEGSGGKCNGMWVITNLMDGGNANNNFNTPPNYSAIQYEEQGIGIREKLVPGTYELEPVNINHRYLSLPTNYKDEYYLIECRIATGWDKYIGDQGLAIYHIDYSDRDMGYSDTYSKNMSAMERWEYNEVNCRPGKECAYFIPASGSNTSIPKDGSLARSNRKLFYPSSTNKSFSYETSPAFTFNDGSDSPLAITNISFDGEKVRFNVIRIGGDIELPNVTNILTDVYQDAAIITWESDNKEFEGESEISIYSDSWTAPKTATVMSYTPGKFAYVAEGLTPRTDYKAEVLFKQLEVKSYPSSVRFKTKAKYDDTPYIFLNNVVRNEDKTFRKESAFPLRVFNLGSGDTVTWYWNDKTVKVSPDGYFRTAESGTLKAEIHKSNGHKDIIIKKITIK